MSAPILSLRSSEPERARLEAAANQARTTLSDFVRRKAREAAEIDLSGRRIIAMPAEAWAGFEAWASAPALAVPALAERAVLRPAWQD